MDTLWNTDTPLIKTERKAIDEGKDTTEVDEILISTNNCIGINFFF